MPEIPKLVLARLHGHHFLYLSNKNQLINDLKHVAIFKSKKELNNKANALKIKNYMILYLHEAKLAEQDMHKEIYKIAKERPI